MASATLRASFKDAVCRPKSTSQGVQLCIQRLGKQPARYCSMQCMHRALVPRPIAGRGEAKYSQIQTSVVLRQEVLQSPVKSSFWSRLPTRVTTFSPKKWQAANHGQYVGMHATACLHRIKRAVRMLYRNLATKRAHPFCYKASSVWEVCERGCLLHREDA